MNKRIAIFYNVLLQNNFKNIVNQQLMILMMSGIYKQIQNMFICCSYLNEQTYQENLKFIKKIQEDFPKIKIIQNGKSVPFEKQQDMTIQHIIEFASENPDCYICYFQALGVTRQGKQSWRLFTTYNLFSNYNQIISLLSTYDVVGSIYCENTGWGKRPHFSGNFWWTVGSYINTLDVNYLRSKKDSRWTNQFFIGTSKNNIKFYNMLSLPPNKTDPYFHIFNLSEVIK